VLALTPERLASAPIGIAGWGIENP